MNNYSLIFVGDHGNTREIAQINAVTDKGMSKTDQEVVDEAKAIMRSFCDKRNFKIYYIRIWNESGVTVF